MSDSLRQSLTLPIHLSNLLSNLTRRFNETTVGELWRYRDLLFFWIRRETTIRYRQTWLGAGWAIAQPLLYTIVFWICFHTVSGNEKGTLPYSLFSFIGSVIWLYFSKAVLGASSSVVLNSKLITRVAFPRLVIPLSTILSGLLDLFIGLFFSWVLAFFWGFTPTVFHLMGLFGLVFLTAALSFGLGAFFGAVHVRYRDVGYALTFLMQLWFFLTPVIYSSPLGQSPWQIIMELNPMTGILRGFRTALSCGTWDVGSLTVSTLWALGTVVIGSLYFRATEQEFADII